MMDQLSDSEIEKLIQTMTKSGTQELNVSQLKQLKTYCRVSDDHIDRVVRHLFNALSANHSQIRVTTVLIIGELFGRSHRFRQLVTENLYDMFELCLELDPKRKLPKPKSFADKLKELTIDLMEKWTKEFGEGYQQLRSAMKYLKDNRLVDFRERVVQNTSQRLRAEEEGKRRENVLKLKITKSVEELSDLSKEVETLLTQINSCFELLLPKITETSDNSCDDYSTRIRHLNDFSINILFEPIVEIVANEDTKPIICNLKEFHSELSKILDNRLKRLIQIMTKGYDLCESHLKKAIDLKCKIESVRQKFLELKIIDSQDIKQLPKQDKDSDDSDDDDFIEVEEKEGLELFIPEERRHEYGLEPLDCNKPSTSGTQTSSIVLKSTDDSFVENRCNARLPSGKLCPRRDSIKCPFHGLIISRDSTGDPIDEIEKQKEALKRANDLPDWQNPVLLRELKAQIGIDLSLKSRKKRRKQNPELEDISKPEITSRKRLERKVFKKSVREKVDKDLDDIQYRNQTQYEDQWNYALQK
ncbi:UV-stimulated scaffold protein A-like [Oppia nitens]|uniref:UV-stimulated scaffold protein A-like n=1 Tax=Oppia nitens TaxID=1686743 RepID=UPI0023DA375A|nr:UV-stimulated scaffold protein A-like [Oppia nitens]